MRQRRRMVWWLKWLGTLGCALLAAAFLVSGWWCLVLERESIRVRPAASVFPGLSDSPSAAAVQTVCLASGTITQLSGGAILIQYTGGIWGASPDSTDTDEWRFRSSRWGFAPDFRHAPWPGKVLTTTGTVRTYPLWIPFAALLAPTLLLWRLDRRVPPWLCGRCRYDLTGNTTGRCPECGTETKSPSSMQACERCRQREHAIRRGGGLAHIRRLRRTAWWLKSLGTLGCALMAAAFVASGWWEPGLQHYRVNEIEAASPDVKLDHHVPAYRVALRGGRIDIFEFQKAIESAAALSWTTFSSERVESPPNFFRWWQPETEPDDFTLDTWIPLWIPFVALLVPTLYFWHRDRRVRREQRRRYRYDLTGNTTGRCPECGVEFKIANSE